MPRSVGTEENDNPLQIYYANDAGSMFSLQYDNVRYDSDGSLTADISLVNKKHVVYDLVFEHSGSVLLPGHGIDTPYFPLVPARPWRVSAKFYPGSALTLKLDRLGHSADGKSLVLWLDVCTLIWVALWGDYLPVRPEDIKEGLADQVRDIISHSAVDLTAVVVDADQNRWQDALQALVDACKHSAQTVYDILYLLVSNPPNKDQIDGWLQDGARLLGLVKVAPVVWDFVFAPRTAQITISRDGPVPTPPPVEPAPPPPPTVDHATLASDATLPAGTAVLTGQAVLKTWRVTNSGTSTWDGYKLIFVQGDQMGGASPVSIPTTAPSQETNISVSLQAPSTSGNKVGYWQIVNRDGVYVDGGRLSVNINVVSPTTGGHITAFSADPPSPSSASTVRLHARVTWWDRFRAMRVKVDNDVIGETSEVDHYFDWNAGSASRGDHTIVLEVADQTDTSWSHPERRVLAYTLQGTPGPANLAPSRPVPHQNPGAYDWYVTIGTPPQLCVQATDPEGDPLEYWFHAEASQGTYDSGWVSSSCFTFGSMVPGTYTWKAKARDAGTSRESDWSDPWHFSVESSGVTINTPSVSPGSPSNAERVDFCLTTSGHATVNIDVRAMVNTASDGSASGEWRYLDGYLPGNNQWCWWWNTLEYSDGDHLVRFDARAWEPDAADARTITYHLNHRRPASPNLLAPIPASGNINEAIYLNSRTVTFKWAPAIRATSYTLHVSTSSSPKDDPSPVLRQSLGSGTTQYTATFTQDYPTLYWQVTATDDVGSTDSGAQRFGIDRVAPTAAVQPLAAAVAESTFPVYWSGTDSLSGVCGYDVQYLDSGRSEWTDWLTVPVTKAYELFTGQPGHTYQFRCRAKDNAGNTGDYPANAQALTKVDPTTRPQTPWWNSAYANKRNIIVLNNMGSMALPVGYPVRLHLDNTTTPTAAEVYNASQTSPKGNDVRVVYNDTTELDRVIQTFSSSAIDIWFRSQVSVGAGSSNNTSHQLYYGNAGAGTPPADPTRVWFPGKDGNTVGLWYYDEGSGSSVYDSSGYGNNGSTGSLSWCAGKFGSALYYPSPTAGAPGAFIPGSSSMNVSAFTFEAFVKRGPTNWGIFAGQGAAGSARERWQFSIQDGKAKVEVWSGGGSTQAFSDGNFLPDTNWHHVAFTFDGNRTVSFYRDGSLLKTVTLGWSGINGGSLDLTLGSGFGSNVPRFEGAMDQVRLSNVVRTSFPYGLFALVTSEPSLALGDPTAPPIAGSPDLAVLSLNAYPNPDGGLLVQAVVKNQGAAPTQNGFYTDLYADHLPGGPGDYTGSIHFWVASPIDTGQSITLTTVITDVSTLGQAMGQAASATGEQSHTLYMQVDSTQAVAEANKSNNISTGTQACIASADAFEPDDSPQSARPLALGENQAHNFASPGDQDWLKIHARTGVSYTIQTGNLGPSSDTYLYLYDRGGQTLLAANDDYDDTLASRIDWNCPAEGDYYLLVRHWNPQTGGCGTAYDIAMNEQTTPPTPLYMPWVANGSLGYAATGASQPMVKAPAATSAPSPAATISSPVTAVEPSERYRAHAPGYQGAWSSDRPIR